MDNIERADIEQVKTALGTDDDLIAFQWILTMASEKIERLQAENAELRAEYTKIATQQFGSMLSTRARLLAARRVNQDDTKTMHEAVTNE